MAASSKNHPQAYVATHYNVNIPAYKGLMAKTFERKTPQEQRALASTFHTLLFYPHTDLQYLNGKKTLFTTMVSVPGTHKVKILYGIVYGISCIRQVLTISKKFLALFGEGSATMLPEQVIMMDNSIRTYI